MSGNGFELEHEAVVFDLDGTLVELAVDWAAVHREVATLLADRGIRTEDRDLWGLWKLGMETGYREAVNEVIATHETTGARESARLPAADAVPEGPVGVCTLNAERAAHTALETHNLVEAVHPDAVVGRDSVATQKPDPEPLLETIRALDARPERTVFVGDGERDAVTAERAGVPFRYVSEWPPDSSAVSDSD